MSAQQASNIVPLATASRRRATIVGERQQFRVVPFTNSNGTKSWRVTGFTRPGKRVRENFIQKAAAQARQLELETEFLRGHSETGLRATRLTADQIKLCEEAVIALGDDWPRLRDAVDNWSRSGKPSTRADSPRIDDAVTEYVAWLKNDAPFRDATRKHWCWRIGVFKAGVPNLKVSEFTAETIETFLASLTVSPVGKDTYRRAVSRFFSWCIERPRRWSAVNPCRDVKVKQSDDAAPPQVLSVAECKSLLRAAVDYKAGLLVPYVAIGLFGGLRPFEIPRISWTQINLADREIRLESAQVKTGRRSKRGRVVSVHKTLAEWLKAYSRNPIYPVNWRKEFDAVKHAAGFGTPTNAAPELKPWPDDVLRHTAISHFFRQTGSYGLCAEQFGNSESVIKKHYQARVSKTETVSFYNLKPSSI